MQQRGFFAMIKNRPGTQVIDKIMVLAALRVDKTVKHQVPEDFAAPVEETAAILLEQD